MEAGAYFILASASAADQHVLELGVKPREAEGAGDELNQVPLKDLVIQPHALPGLKP